MTTTLFDDADTLRASLSDWTDVDVAAYHLGSLLGVLPVRGEDERQQDHWFRCKSIFWCANGLGYALHEGLVGLAASGILERKPDQDGVISGPSAFRFVRNPPTEADPEPPEQISAVEHYMALMNGLFALRALGPLADEIEIAMAGIHAQQWKKLNEVDKAQLEFNIEVAQYRWKNARKPLTAEHLKDDTP